MSSSRRGRSFGFSGLCRRFSAFQISQPPLALLNFVQLFAHKIFSRPIVVVIVVRNMATRLFAFNAYLIAVLLLGVGCQSMKKKEATTLRLHLEVNQDQSGRSAHVPVYRQSPIYVNVQNAPFLMERNVANASVVESLGSFQIMIQLDRRGTWLLEEYTTVNRGKRIAIFSQFGDARWLAAPVMNKRITDGVLVFTPDATREESERIVRGLNNVAKVMQKDNP
jgi:hypothetical protein